MKSPRTSRTAEAREPKEASPARRAARPAVAEAAAAPAPAKAGASKAAAPAPAAAAPAAPVDFDSLLAKLGLRDRTHLEKHLTRIEDPAHVAMYRRLVASLATLAPLAVQTLGEGALIFFVADGKYRMQAFALEDARDGKIVVYVPDITAKAVAEKIIADAGTPESPTGGKDYNVIGHRGVTIHAEALDATNTPNPAAHVKNMLGWNRKALRITLPVTAVPAQVEVTERLAGLAAKAWAPK